MEIVYIIIAIVYLLIGRAVAEKRWEWDGYYEPDTGIIVTTIFWPIYLLWVLLGFIVGIFMN